MGGTEHRLPLVDALRGFALLGVVVSNVAVVWGAGAGLIPPSSLDEKIGELTADVITGKFLALFSLLFGVSFGLAISLEGGTPGVSRYLRRLAILFVFGVLNRVLFGPDILMTYAVLGALLLLFRRASDRTLIVFAVISLLLPQIWDAVASWMQYRPSPPPVSRAERMRLATEGAYVELVRVRILMLPRWLYELLQGQTAYLALFLTGLLAARRRLLAHPDEHVRIWWRTFGLAIALTALGYMAQSMLRPHLRDGGPAIGMAFGVAWPTTTFVQAVAYAAGFVLLWIYSPRTRRWLAMLSPAGRMALTNYLAASILTTVVVLVAGIYGRVSVAAAAGLGLALWVAEVVWSRWCLRAYSLGPAEWAWRKLASTPTKT